MLGLKLNHVTKRGPCYLMVPRRESLGVVRESDHNWRVQLYDGVHLTHPLLDKVGNISQTILSDKFSWMKSFVFWFKLHTEVWFE